MNAPMQDPHSTHQPPPGAGLMNTVRWVLFGGLTLLAGVSVARTVPQAKRLSILQGDKGVV